MEKFECVLCRKEFSKKSLKEYDWIEVEEVCRGVVVFERMGGDRCLLCRKCQGEIEKLKVLKIGD